MKDRIRRQKLNCHQYKGKWRLPFILCAFLFLSLSFVSGALAAQIKSVQRGVVNFDTWDISMSVNINAVDMSKTIVILQNTPGNSTNDQNFFYTVQFESNSTIQINRAGAATSNASAAVAWQVIEFVDGVRVQRGISSISQNVTQKKIIIAADTDLTKAVPVINTQAPFTNATTTQELFLLPSFITEVDKKLQLDRYSATSAKTVQITWQVIEFLADASVQTSTASLPVASATPQTLDVAISPVKNPLLFNYFTFRTGTTDASDEKKYLTTAEFTGASPYSNIRFTRYIASNNANTDVSIRYYVVDLSGDSNLYQANSFNYPANSATLWAISSSSLSGSLAKITTAANTLVTGDRVTITGHTVSDGTSNYYPYDGYWKVTRIDGSNFTLDGSVYFGFAGAATGYVVKVDNVTLAPASTQAIDTARAVLLRTTRANSNTNAGRNDVMDSYCIAANLYSATTTDIFRHYDTSRIEASITVFQSLEFCPLTLNQPNGTETGANAWVVGTPHSIKWAYADSRAGSAVKIKLDTSGSTTLSGNYATTIYTTANVTDAAKFTDCVNNVCTFTWKPGQDGQVSETDNHIGTQLRVAVIDTGLNPAEDGTARNYDISNANFTMRGSISNVHLEKNSTPVSLVNIEAQDIYVKWSHTGSIGNVKIELDETGDGIYESELTASTSGTADSWLWPSVPNVVSLNAVIRVKELAATDPTDKVEGLSSPFEIRPGLTLNKPLSSDSYLTGATYRVEWTPTGNVGAVNFTYSVGGSNFAAPPGITNPITGYTGGACPVGKTCYDWTVAPATLRGATKLQLVKSDNANVKAFDTGSEGTGSGPNTTFTIYGSINIDSPPTTDILRTLQNTDITMSLPGGAGSVGVTSGFTYKYCTNYSNPSPTWITMANPTSGDGVNVGGFTPSTYTWSVRDIIGDDVGIRVEEKGLNSDTIYATKGPYKVRGYIAVTSPTAVSLLKVGETYTIQWTASGSIGQVYIDMDRNGLGTYGVPIVGPTAPAKFEKVGVDCFPVSIDASAQSFVWGKNTYYTEGTCTTPAGAIPAETCDPCNIKVYKTTEPNPLTGAADVSDNFKLKNKISNVRITQSPPYSINQTIEVKWDPQPYASNWGTAGLQYSTDGSTWVPFSNENGVANSGEHDVVETPGTATSTYLWKVPNESIISSSVRLRVGVSSDTNTPKNLCLDGVCNDSGQFQVTGSMEIDPTSEANGGASDNSVVWELGTGNKQIKWTVIGNLGNVDLSYNINGGAFSNSITTVACNASGTYTYNWPIPDNALGNLESASIKIKLSSTSVSSEPVSAYSILVKSKLTLNSFPVSVEVDNPDDTADYYNITWTKNGYIDKVQLYYDLHSGTGDDLNGATEADNYTNAITIQLGDGSTSFDPQLSAVAGGTNWVIPNAITGTVRMRLKSVNTPSIKSDLASDFAIKGKIVILSPTVANKDAGAWLVDGGVGTVLDKTQTIRWRNCGTLGDVRIKFSANGSAFTELPNQPIVNNGESGIKTYTWRIPATWELKDTNTTENYLKIEDASVSKQSDKFEIKGQLRMKVPGFTGGEVYDIGELGASVPIEWYYAGNLGNINIWYSPDHGLNWGVLPKATIPVTTVQPYSLIVSNATTVEGRIKIEQDTDTIYVTSTSGDSTPPGYYFTLRGSIFLDGPVNEPTDWKVDSPDKNKITWHTVGIPAGDNVVIDLDTNSGLDNYPIPIDTTPNDGEYIWVIPVLKYNDVTSSLDPTSLSDKCKIRIRYGSIANTAPVTTFKIRPSLTLTQPIDNSSPAEVGSPLTIKWDLPKGNVPFVKIRISTDGTTWPDDNPPTSLAKGGVVASSVDSSKGPIGYTDWNVTDIMTNTAKVRIEKSNDPLITSPLQGFFFVKGTITGVHVKNLAGDPAPPAPIDLPAYSTKYITWNSTGSLGTVTGFYSTNADSVTPPPTWTEITATCKDVPIGNGNCSWSIPASPSAAVQVKLVSATSINWQTITGYSPALPYNNIIGNISEVTVVADGDGTVMRVGGNKTIQWRASGYDVNSKFDIYYRYDGGLWSANPVSGINGVTGTPNGEYRTWEWVGVPNTISNDVDFKVKDHPPLDKSSSESAVNYIIKGQLDLQIPNNEVLPWTVGENKIIQWSQQGGIGSLKIELSVSGTFDPIDYTNGQVFTIESNYDLGQDGVNQYTWPAGVIITPAARKISENCKIKISNNTLVPDFQLSDVSTAVFKIRPTITSISNPGAGDNVWYKGELTKKVIWQAKSGTKPDGTSPKVILEYGINIDPATPMPNGSSVDCVNGANEFNAWPAGVPDEKDENVKVRISFLDYARQEDITTKLSSAFAIRPDIDVTVNEPVNKFRVGSTYTDAITWNLNGSTKVSKVKVLYSTDGGLTYPNNIAIVLSPTAGCNWGPILDTAVNDAVFVKVVDFTGDIESATVYTTAPAVGFPVYGNIVMSAPAAEANWAVGDIDKAITWSQFGALGNVDVYVDYGLGAGLEPLFSAAVSPAPWNPIPDKVSNNVKIKVAQRGKEATVYDEKIFHITGKAAINAIPNTLINNDIALDPYPVNWTTTGLNVNLISLDFFDGTSWSPIVLAQNISKNAKPFNWTLPTTTSASNCKLRIRITDPDQPSTQIESNEFWIHGKITVDEPNSATKWVVGNVLDGDIKFKVYGKIDKVNISYSRTGGEPYDVPVASMVNVTSGGVVNTVHWSIPADVAVLTKDQGKIKIADASWPTVVGYSNPFMIKGKIESVYPQLDNQTLTYTGASTQAINWTTTGLPMTNVKIYLSVNDGVDYLVGNEIDPGILKSAGVAGIGSYSWTLPADKILGKHLKLKVVDKDNEETGGESGFTFEIVGSLALNSPVSTDKWAVGTIQNITWTPTGTFGRNVQVQASTNDFAVGSFILDTTYAAGTTGVPQSYPWNISNPAWVSNNVKVRVYDPLHAATIKSEMAAPFAVVGTISNVQVDNTVWYRDANQRITWDQVGDITNVKIRYKTKTLDSFNDLKVITLDHAGHLNGPNEYTILAANVPDENSEECYIQVLDKNNADAHAEFGPFSMRPKIAVSTSLTKYKTGTTNANAVTWTINGVAGSSKVTKVDVVYSLVGQGGPYDKTIATQVNAIAGACDWTVASDASSNNVIIKVVDSTPSTANANTFGITDPLNPIKIVANITIAPLGANVDWEVGTTSKTISWTKDGPGVLEGVYIYADYGAGYEGSPVATITSNLTTNWGWGVAEGGVPNKVGNTVKLKVVDRNNAEAFDESGIFHIVGKFTIDAVPNPLINGTADDPFTIRAVTTATGATGVKKAKIQFFDGTSWADILGAELLNVNSVTGEISFPGWPVPTTTNAVSCRLRVVAVDPLQPDTSLDLSQSNQFWVHGKISIAEPNVLSKWTAGLANGTVRFTITGKMTDNKVNILYSKDDGVDNYTAHTIASGLLVNQGENTLTVTMPTDKEVLTKDKAKIKIVDFGYSTVFLPSSLFMVKGQVTNVYPQLDNQTLSYTGASTQAISWNTTGMPMTNVKIYLSVNDGVDYLIGNEIDPAIVKSAGVGGLGSYTWNIPADKIVGKHLKLKVVDKDNEEAAGESAFTFEIVGSLALSSPVSTDKWAVNTIHNITWMPTGTFGRNVQVQASTNNFAVGSFILDTPFAAGTSGVAQSYPWNISNPAWVSNSVKVRVYDPLHADTIKSEMADPFAVVGVISNVQVDNTVWYRDANQRITWDQVGDITNVKIRYKTKTLDTFNDLKVITLDHAGHLNGPNEYTILAANVPDENSEECYIQVLDKNNADAHAEFGPFSMRPKIAVSTSLTKYKTGTTNASAVTWTINGGAGSSKVTKVDVVYSLVGQGGPYDKTIATQVNAIAGACDWTVASDASSNNVIVKVIDSTPSTANANTFGITDPLNPIKIVANITIAPLGANVDWEVGTTTKTISWTKDGPGVLEGVFIYVDYGLGAGYEGSPVATITSNAVTSWGWGVPEGGVPNQVSNAVKLKVVDRNNAEASDESGVFHIVGKFTIDAVPNPLINGSADDPFTIHAVTTATGATGVKKAKIQFFDGTSWADIVGAELLNVNSVTGEINFPGWAVPTTTNAVSCRLRVVAVDPVQPDTSLDLSQSNQFWVHGKISIAEPNVLSQWTAGLNDGLVKFTVTGKMTDNKVNILYSKDDGVDNYATHTIASGLLVAQGENQLQVTMPTDKEVLTKDLARIKIVDFGYSTVFLPSSKFMVKAQITNVYPQLDNQELSYTGASTQAITWNTIGQPITNVKIYLSVNSGTDYLPANEIDPAIVKSAGVAGVGSYTWSIPADKIIGKVLKLKVVDKDNEAAGGQSAFTFEIVGSLALSSPISTDKWAIGTLHNITWTPTGTFGRNVQVQASTNDFLAGSFILDTPYAAGTTGVPQSYPWDLSNPAWVNNNVKVRVYDPLHPNTVKAEMAAPFAIVGVISNVQIENSIWYRDVDQKITWDQVGDITNVKIRYKTKTADPFNDLKVITLNDAGHLNGANQFIIPAASVPDENSEECYIQVLDANNADAHAEIGPFSMRPKITVATSANLYKINTTNVDAVTWSINGLAGSSKVSKVDVIYSIAGQGGPYDKIISTGVTASLGKCNWVIASNDASSNNVVVKVVDSTPTTANANTFGITDPANPILIVANINVGGLGANVDWEVGTTSKQISWTKEGPGALEGVFIYADYGSGYEGSPVATITSNAVTSWGWGVAEGGVPNRVGNSIKLKVVDRNNSQASAESGVFHIVGKFTIDAVPNPLIAGSVDDPYTIHAVTTAAGANGVKNAKIQFFDGTSWADIVGAENLVVNGVTGEINFSGWGVPITTNSVSCRLRVVATNPVQPDTCLDLSQSNQFWVHGKITVQNPSASVNWSTGQSNLIRFTVSGKISQDKVNIVYSKDDGLDGYLTYTIATGLAVTQGVNDLNYTMPTGNDLIYPAQDLKARIKVVDRDYSTVYGLSGTFTLGSVSVNALNGGSPLLVKTAGYNITWVAKGIDNVNVYYSTQAGAAGTYQLIGSAVASAPSLAWATTPDVVSDNCYIKVVHATETVDSAVIANISPQFSLFEKFTNISPATGTPLTAGQNDLYSQIKWSKLGTGLQTVKIYLSKNSGGTWIPLFNGNTVPANCTNCTQDWTVTDTVHSDQCLIKVESTVNPNNYGISGVPGDAADPFVIKDYLEITKPTTGELPWSVGSTYPIKWNFVGPTEYGDPAQTIKLKIQYAADPTSPDPQLNTYNTIPGADQVPINNTCQGGTQNNCWDWLVGNTTILSNNKGKIKISATYIPLATATSLGTLTIRGNVVPQEIDVSNPLVEKVNGVPVLKVGDTYNLFWTSTGGVASVNLYYSTNGAAGPWLTNKINAADWDAGTVYPWTIPPDIIGNTLRIVVQDAGNANVYNMTANDFRVVGKIALKKPYDMLEPDWEIGKTNATITWRPTGTFPSRVKIEISRDNFVNDIFQIAEVDAGLNGQDTSYTLFEIPDKPTGITPTAKIRVSDADATRSTLVTSQTKPGFEFKVKGWLEVTEPNQNSLWKVGDTPNIRWVKHGTIDNVKIEFYNGVTRLDPNITDSTPAVGQLYNQWQVPDGAVSFAAAKIKITDTVDSSITAESVAPAFTVRGTINVTAPATYLQAINAAEIFNIKWARGGNYSTVDIMYSVNGGLYEFVRDINNAPADNYDASLGAAGFPWYVPADKVSGNVLIKIIDNDDPNNVTDLSEQFKIIGKVFFNVNTIPQLNEKWGIGGVGHTIKWTTQGTLDTVRLAYSTDGGQNYTTIADAAGNTGDIGILWVIPNIEGIVSPNAMLKIYHISEASLTKAESPQFSIVPSFTITQPANDGLGQAAELVADQDYEIKWSRLGSNPYVKLYYSTDNFNSPPGTAIETTEVAADGQNLVNNDGSFIWHVPDIVDTVGGTSNNVKVRVAYSVDTTVDDPSDVFRIVPGITVRAPDSSVDMADVGRDYTIRWTCTSANVPKVRIYYSSTGGQNDDYFNKEITTGPNYADNSGAAGAERTYVWTNVPNDITDKLKIKIVDLDAQTTTAYDVSNSNGKIKAYFELLTPNGAADGSQAFTVNQAQTITWTWNGSVTKVKIEYCKNDDWANPVTIATTTNNDGIYGDTPEEPFVMPDFISDNVKIRVRAADPFDADAKDASNNYFKIRGAFSNLSAVGGGAGGINGRLEIGYPAALQWTTTGGSNTLGGRSLSAVNIVAYSTLGAGDPGFPYAEAAPYVIKSNYANTVNGTTTYSWDHDDTLNVAGVPDLASDNVVIRVIDAGDANVKIDFAVRIIGSFKVTQPDNEAQAWFVDEVKEIKWNPTGNSIQNCKISYSTVGNSINPADWHPIKENEGGNADDGIVANDGSVMWTVPDDVSSNCIIKIEDPNDNTVLDVSDNPFEIYGDYTFTNPPSGNVERWVTNETSHTIAWSSNASTVTKVNLYYFKNSDPSVVTTIAANYNNIKGNNTKSWTIPDDRANTVQIRIEDANLGTYAGQGTFKSGTYKDSGAFKIDYYNITWNIRDVLTNLPITGGLTINDTSGWAASSLSSSTPIEHATPYGSWSAAWTHRDYGDYTLNYTADQDQTLDVYLESKVVHVWEAKTDFVYDTANDKLIFTSTLMRDGSVVTGAKNCYLEIYNPDAPGTVLNPPLTSAAPDSAGFFVITWNNTDLDSTRVYSARTVIENILGGIFKTPFTINLVPTVSLYDMKTLVNSVLDKPMSQVNAELQATLATQTNLIDSKTTEQTNIITTKMNEQTNLITTKTNEMKSAVETSLSSFETRSNEAIVKLQAGADQAVEAGEQAAGAAQELEATAKKYSWNASVSPNPALVGDMITLSVQGQPGMLPSLSIYSWDNKTIIRDTYLKETTDGLYVYEFGADARFTPGKAYTFIVSEPITGGLVSGSGIIESMSITTIAGLASAAPAAEAAAKKALDAIEEVQSVLMSGGTSINISDTLKELQTAVTALPAAIAKEGPSQRIVNAVNEISDRLQTLMGKEGYDMGALLEEALDASPSMKALRGKTDAINSVIDLLMQMFENKFGGMDSPVISTSLQPGSVKFRIAAVNPSKLKTHKIQVKYYLPEEVKPKDILESGGLSLEYDSEKSIYYVYKNDVELAPAEVRSFEVHVEDIWVFPDAKISELKTRTDSILDRLSKTEYYTKAKEIADTIYPRLEEIVKLQTDDSVSRAQHIGYYRQNKVTIEQVKEDIARMEKLLSTAGAAPAPEMLVNSKVKSDAPSKTMTWIIIFIIITFIGLLAGVLFFTWHRQANLTRETMSAAKKSAFPESHPDEETKESQQENTK